MTADRDRPAADSAPPPLPSPSTGSVPGPRAAVAPGQRGTHAFLVALFQDAPLGFALLDTELRYVMVNKTLAAINGVPAADHIGRFVTDVLPEIGEAAVGALWHVVRTGESLRDVEVAGRTPASREYKTWLEDFFQVRTAEGEVLGVAAVLADVTAQRRSEGRLSQLIDSLVSFVGLCLPDGTLVEVNRSTLEAGGLAAADVIGRKFWETPWWTWNPRVAQELRQAVERARQGEAARYDVEVMMADGLMTIDFRLEPVVEHGEVVALVPSATDITARRRSTEQAEGVAALARRLNAASTVNEVAETIRNHTAEAIGCRHATLALLDTEAGNIQLLQSPSLPEHLAREFSRLPLDSPIAIARCIRDRTTVVLADPLTLEDVDGSATELERLRAGRAAAGVTVTATAPLLDTHGEVIGALAMGWPHVEDLDAEVRARLRTLAELGAQAVERARLTDAHLVAAERSQALADLAQALASAVTIGEIWQVVARLAPQVVGARNAALGLIDADGTSLELYFPESLAARALPPRRQPLSSRRPQTDAARTGEPVVLATPGEIERRYPGLLAELEVEDLVATAVLPLRDSTDRVIGTLGLGWVTPVSFDPLLRSVLDTMAEVCGQTLERARLHAAEHELVEGLQQRLLRPMPVVPGLGAHAVYRAAQTAVGIGGDFHDGVVLPGGRLAVVVGDVAGHGMEAAADMAQLRTLLSTLLAAGIGLDQLFAQADTALDQVATLSLATAVAAVVDPVARTLSYVHAGHPPLVLHRPGGVTATLSDARGGLLGAGIAEAPTATVPFAPGSVLVGYTDGLVETRSAALDVGIAELVAAVDDAVAADPGLDAAGIAASVLERCVGDRRLTDDVALLVVTYPPADIAGAAARGTPGR